MSAVVERHASVHPTMAAVLNLICPPPVGSAQHVRDQAFFDKSLAHIRKQGRASSTPVNPDRPMACSTWYRAPNGDTCTIGCHFNQHLYSQDIETVPVAALMKERRYLARAMGWPTVDLAEMLQCAHDSVLRKQGMDAFEAEMAKIALHRGLTFTPKVAA